MGTPVHRQREPEGKRGEGSRPCSRREGSLGDLSGAILRRSSNIENDCLEKKLFNSVLLAGQAAILYPRIFFINFFFLKRAEKSLS